MLVSLPFLEVNDGSESHCCQPLLARRRLCRALGLLGLHPDGNGVRKMEESCSNKKTDLFILAVISDPNDPKFDLEAYLTMSEAK